MTTLPSPVKLTRMQRAIFPPYYLHGQTQQQIADELRISQQAVSRRWSRIQKRFLAAGLHRPAPSHRGKITVAARHLSRISFN